VTEVRLATPADLPAILAISNWAAAHTAANFAVEPEPLAQWEGDYTSTNAMYPWLVAVAVAVAVDDDDGDGGTVLGFAKAGRWKGRCAYAYSVEVTVYVHPDHHGRGVGRRLYERLFAILKQQGYHAVFGGITQPNEASVRLHESFGMRRVALFERVGWKFGRWHDVAYWQGTLREAEEPPTRVLSVAEATAQLGS